MNQPPCPCSFQRAGKRLDRYFGSLFTASACHSQELFEQREGATLGRDRQNGCKSAVSEASTSARRKERLHVEKRG